MTEENETTEIEFTEETESHLCSLMETWAKFNLSTPSFEMFANIAEDVGADLEEIQRAIGVGVMNEIVLEAIHAQMEKEELENREEGC